MEGWTKDAVESSIISIRENGSEEDKRKLDHLLLVASKEGVSVPWLLVRRIASPWMREHTKAYKTPTILKKWKDEMPSNVAVWFFHECDIMAIEIAFESDYDTEPGKNIDPLIIATCYAYLGLTGERNRHGTWYQGKEAFDNSIIQKKVTSVAHLLHRLCTSRTPMNIKDDAFLTKWLKDVLEDGTPTCDLEPISFAGEGRRKLFE